MDRREKERNPAGFILLIFLLEYSMSHNENSPCILTISWEIKHKEKVQISTPKDLVSAPFCKHESILHALQLEIGNKLRYICILKNYAGKNQRAVVMTHSDVDSIE